MPTLTFSRFENRILTRIPCPTQRVLNCSSRCSPPLELRSRSIASRLARSRVRRRTRPIVARLAFWFWWWFDRLIFFCCCSSVVCVGVSLFCVEKRALFVSFGMKKKKKRRRPKQKWWETDTKREKPKKISELHQLHITHTCEHISSSNEKNIFNLLFEKLKHLFFLLDYSRLQIFPHRETTSVSNAIYRVMCA